MKLSAIGLLNKMINYLNFTILFEINLVLTYLTKTLCFRILSVLRIYIDYLCNRRQVDSNAFLVVDQDR
jgi:hypothetical protein